METGEGLGEAVVVGEVGGVGLGEVEGVDEGLD